MTLGLPISTWMFLIGLRVLCILVALVCVIFGIYEGMKIDRSCEEAQEDNPWWYWTF